MDCVQPSQDAGSQKLVYRSDFDGCSTCAAVMWGIKQQNTVFATGKSILNRTSNTSIGALVKRINTGG